HQGGRTVVDGAGVAGGHRAVRTEHRLELGDLLVGGARARAVGGGDDGAGGPGQRGDRVLREASADLALRTVLDAHAPTVLVLAGDAGEGGDVRGGLAHRDVDVGQLALCTRVRPRDAALGELVGAGLGVVEQR